MQPTHSSNIEVAGTTTLLGPLFPKVYPADAEPTLTNGELAMWVDTNDSNAKYVVFRYADVQHKLKLTATGLGAT